MKKYSVPTFIVLPGLSFLLFLFGLGWTLQNHFVTKESPIVEKSEPTTKKKKDDEIVIVALGDSLTRGTGDDNGKGYIGYLVDQLEEKSDEKLTLYNLGVKGYRSAQLLEQVQQKGIQREAKEADYILITIGGNDLFQGGQTIISLDLQQVEELKKQYLENLQKTITELRTVNENATIFLIGLYNPFIDLDEAGITTKVVRQWNFETSQLLDGQRQTVFVPTFDLFQLKVNDYLYSDKFHPNSEGYKLIAERVASLITW